MTKDLIGNYDERIKGTTEVAIDDTKYNATQLETESVKIEDPGTGKAVVLRHFFFKAKPRGPHEHKPTKQDLFSEVKTLIHTQLWADGLEPREDMRVEVHTKGKLKNLSKALYTEMTRNGSDYVIMVAATPKKGVLLNERPNLAL